MGLASDMEKMSEDIVSSYDMRVKAVGMLVNNVHKILKDFTVERKSMAAEQARNLRDFLNGLSRHVEDLRKKADAFLKEVRKNNKEMSEAQAEELKIFIADLNTNVSNMLKSYQKDRRTAGDALRANLKKSKKDLENYAKNKLKEFSDGRAAMSDQLRSYLAKYVRGVVSDTNKLLSDFENERKKAANGIKEMATHWQAAAATLAKKRGVKPKVEAQTKARSIEEAIEEITSPIKRKEGPSNIEEKLLAVISEHPEGISLGNAARIMGIDSSTVGKLSKKLVGGGKARKKRNIYFPADSK